MMENLQYALWIAPIQPVIVCLSSLCGILIFTSTLTGKSLPEVTKNFIAGVLGLVGSGLSIVVLYYWYLASPNKLFGCIMNTEVCANPSFLYVAIARVLVLLLAVICAVLVGAIAKLLLDKFLP